MALPISLKFPAVPSPLSSRATASFVTARRIPARTSLPLFKHAIGTLTVRTSRTTKSGTVNSVQESQENSESDGANAQAGPPDDRKTVDQPADSSENLGAEIKEALKQKKLENEGGLLSGVGEEIREIEWPAFGKVLGTTGVVIGVIAGSSVVLLTVNALLAELSDRVFAGKGVQDFFS